MRRIRPRSDPRGCRRRRGCGFSRPASRTRSASTSRRSSIARFVSCAPATGTRISSTTRRWSSTSTPSVAIVRFLWGALQGEWRSLDGFSIDAIYSTRRFAAAAIGVVDRLGHLPPRDGTGVAQRRRLLAAAQLAVRPMHVRESHFVLTDVPMAALTTLAMWMTVRADAAAVPSAPMRGPAPPAASLRPPNTTAASPSSPWLAAWVLREASCGRPRREAAGDPRRCGGRVPDLARRTRCSTCRRSSTASPRSSRDSPTPPRLVAIPAWLLYLKHLSPPGRASRFRLASSVWSLLLCAPRTRVRRPFRSSLFALAYFYVISTHSHVFGRYCAAAVAAAVRLHRGRRCSRSSRCIGAASSAETSSLASRCSPAACGRALRASIVDERSTGWIRRSGRTREPWPRTG